MNKSASHPVVRPLAISFACVAMSAAVSRASFEVFDFAGATAAAVTPTRDAFRTAIGGGTVAGANGSFGGIRREINWDAVPNTVADGNAFPGNFFNVNSPRGAVFSTPGTGFLVSSNAGQGTPPLFGFPNEFAAFSPQRLFTAVNSNITDVTFFVPGTNIPAATTAFGAIFNDVEVAGDTKIQFFDQNNTMIFSQDASVSVNQGFSFVGGVAGEGEEISRVRLISGENTIVSNGVLGNPTADIVVMDDFLFAEPTAVPEPGALSLVGAGLFGLSVLRLSRRRNAALAGG